MLLLLPLSMGRRRAPMRLFLLRMQLGVVLVGRVPRGRNFACLRLVGLSIRCWIILRHASLAVCLSSIVSITKLLP